MRALFAAVFLETVVACSSEGGRPAPADDDPIPADAARDAGASRTSANDGGAADSGDGSDGVGCPPTSQVTTPGAVCDPTQAWGALFLLPSELGFAGALVAVSADERTLLWVESGPQARLYTSDRTGSGLTDFGPAVSIDLELLAGGQPELTLSPDGLAAVYVAADGRSFAALRRASRGDAFARAAEASDVAESLAPLNAELAKLGADTAIGDPVLSASGTSMVFSVFPRTGEPAGSATIHESRRIQGKFGAPRKLDDCELGSGTGQRRRIPTGLSSDGRTLFYVDELRGVTRAAFRDAPDARFSRFVDLGSRSDVQPNADCSRLWSSRTANGLPALGFEAR